MTKFHFKLKTYGKLLNLHACYQRVALNDQNSSLQLIKSTVPQGPVAARLTFLIYINDLTDNFSSTCKISADYTSLFAHIFDKTSHKKN